jgi:hypothetical protein
MITPGPRPLAHPQSPACRTPSPQPTTTHIRLCRGPAAPPEHPKPHSHHYVHSGFLLPKDMNVYPLKAVFEARSSLS